MSMFSDKGLVSYSPSSAAINAILQELFEPEDKKYSHSMTKLIDRNSLFYGNQQTVLIHETRVYGKVPPHQAYPDQINPVHHSLLDNFIELTSRYEQAYKRRVGIGSYLQAVFQVSDDAEIIKTLLPEATHKHLRNWYQADMDVLPLNEKLLAYLTGKPKYLEQMREQLARNLILS